MYEMNQEKTSQALSHGVGKRISAPDVNILILRIGHNKRRFGVGGGKDTEKEKHS